VRVLSSGYVERVKYVVLQDSFSMPGTNGEVQHTCSLGSYAEITFSFFDCLVEIFSVNCKSEEEVEGTSVCIIVLLFKHTACAGVKACLEHSWRALQP